MPKRPGLHGIRVQAAMAWLTSVLLRGAPLTPPPVPASDDPTEHGGGSPNMRLLFAVCHWVYALRVVERKRLLLFLDKLDLAHGLGEEFSATHLQLWYGGMGAALLEARTVGDQEIARRIIKWFQFEFLVARVASHEPPTEEDPWLPGGRGVYERPKQGIRELRGSHSVRGRALKALKDGNPGGRISQDYLGPWCLSRLPADTRAEILTWPEGQELPPTWWPFRAKRFADGFYAYFKPPSPESVWPGAVLSTGEDAEGRWISEIVNRERIGRYAGEPVISIDTPGADTDRIGRRQ